MVSLGDGFLLLTILSGGFMCWLGVYCYRRWDGPGTTAFGAFTLLLGFGATASPALVFVRGAPSENATPQWFEVSLFLWVVGMVPWILFALQYTGRTTQIRWRTLFALSAPVAGFFGLIISETTGVFGSNIVTQFLGTVALIYTLALLAVGGYLLLRTSAEYGHLSLKQGISVVIAGITPLLLLNYIGTISQELQMTTTYGIFSLAFITPAVGLSLAVFRYQMFESTPAAGALGEQAIPRETDDLVFVVDRDDRIIKLNEQVTTTLGLSERGPLGEPFTSVVGQSVGELDGAETVELETAAGQRKFDPQVTAFTDQHGHRLGSLLSLRDVTDRELRKQRLEVLNRVLRHNLRNRVDVIKSNAEAVDSEVTTDYTEAIRDSADGLATLSSKARATDQLVSRPVRHSRGDLSATIRDLAGSNGSDIVVETPDSAPLVTDWEALRKAVDSALENAVEHADERVRVTVEETASGYEITVVDDGPGIPDSELASLDAETETPLQHGTGLGLWQLEWGVTKLGGDLSFETADGTTVRIAVPDHRRDEGPPSV
jgi:signal transduction histidine kinase